MRIHFRGRTEEKTRRSKIMVACWIADAAGKAKNNASIRYHHGMVLAKKGRGKEAATELKAALSLDPKFPGADDAKKTLEILK